MGAIARHHLPVKPQYWLHQGKQQGKLWIHWLKHLPAVLSWNLTDNHQMTLAYQQYLTLLLRSFNSFLIFTSVCLWFYGVSSQPAATFYILLLPIFSGLVMMSCFTYGVYWLLFWDKPFLVHARQEVQPLMGEAMKQCQRPVLPWLFPLLCLGTLLLSLIR